MKISHESPKELLKLSIIYNDFDYCLLPLALKDPDYLQFYKDSINKGRRVILDNGLWEGHVPDHEEYLDFIIEHGFNEIIPIDRWKDPKFTVESALKTKEDLVDRGYPDIKLACVVHGNNIAEYADCYIELSKFSDTICFPMELEHGKFSRSDVLNKLDPYINFQIKHHILGINNPIELLSLKKIPWVDSIDTSSPILHGMLDIEYNEFGLKAKSPIKMIDLYYKRVEYPIIVNNNIDKFREWATR